MFSQSEITRVPPVTELRSPPLSRTTGAIVPLRASVAHTEAGSETCFASVRQPDSVCFCRRIQLPGQKSGAMSCALFESSGQRRAAVEAHAIVVDSCLEAGLPCSGGTVKRSEVRRVRWVSALWQTAIPRISQRQSLQVSRQHFDPDVLVAP